MSKVKEAGICRVSGTRRTFRYVDYELVPTRVADGKVRFDNGNTQHSALHLDLLLTTANRVPVVGEIKARSDKDPYFALIQALAHAAHLGTPHQTRRLKECYPDRSGAGSSGWPSSSRTDRSARTTSSCSFTAPNCWAKRSSRISGSADDIGFVEFLEARLEDDGLLALELLPSPTPRPVAETPTALAELKKTIASWEANVRRLSADNALLESRFPRDIWWFTNAARVLYGADDPP